MEESGSVQIIRIREAQKLTVPEHWKKQSQRDEYWNIVLPFLYPYYKYPVLTILLSMSQFRIL
jgi:hypothetical protein